MPAARVLFGLTAPLAGAVAAWAVCAITGAGDPVAGYGPVVLGAWLATALGVSLKARVEDGIRARIALVGPASFAQDLAGEFESSGIGAYEVVGWIGPDNAPGDGSIARLGPVEQIRAIVAGSAIDLVALAPDDVARRDEGALGRDSCELVADACLDLGVRMIEANQLYEDVLGHVPLGTVGAAWFSYMMHPSFRATPGAWKRAFDLLAGVAMAAVAVPLVTIGAIAVKLHDGGPVFYRQRRLGERGEEFEILKLRSMRVDAEAAGEARWSGSDDNRVTPVGRVLRRTHVDELPQLWNVLRGEMTLVGPRPERPEIVVSLERRFPHYNRRHLVKPGLTGWAQIRCGYAGSEAGTAWKLCHDLFYVKHRSMLADALILVETAFEATRDAHRALRAPRERFILSGETRA